MLGRFHEDVSKQNFKNTQSCLSVERFSKWHHCSQPLLWWYKILSLWYHTLQVSLEHGQTDLKICLKYLLQCVIIGMSPGCFQSVNCKLSIKTTFILEETNRARTHIVSTGGVAMIFSESQETRIFLLPKWKFCTQHEKEKQPPRSLIPINHRANFLNCSVFFRAGGTKAVLLKGCMWTVMLSLKGETI